MTFGSESMWDHELLELLLFYPLPRVNTNEVAHGLHEQFGDLSGILSAPGTELQQVRGVSGACSDFLKCVSLIGQHIRKKTPGLSGSADISHMEGYFEDYFDGSELPLCLLVCFGRGMNITGHITFTPESFLSGSLTVRRLWELLMKYGAYHVVLGINCGERPAVPGADEYAVLRGISENFAPIGIPLEDCIICGHGRSFSMRSHGAFSFINNGG